MMAQTLILRLSLAVLLAWGAAWLWWRRNGPPSG